MVKLIKIDKHELPEIQWHSCGGNPRHLRKEEIISQYKLNKKVVGKSLYIVRFWKKKYANGYSMEKGTSSKPHWIFLTHDGRVLKSGKTKKDVVPDFNFK